MQSSQKDNASRDPHRWDLAVVILMGIRGGGVGPRPDGPASAQGGIRLIIIKKKNMMTPMHMHMHMAHMHTDSLPGPPEPPQT